MVNIISRTRKLRERVRKLLSLIFDKPPKTYAARKKAQTPGGRYDLHESLAPERGGHERPQGGEEQVLLWIRTGPGALVLPNEVSKIQLEFARKKEGGHFGPRRFWRDMLPKIKYRNPTVSVEILRHGDPTGPARLNIFTKAAGDTPVHSVDIKAVHQSEILAQLVSRTNAVELKPTEQEEMELEEMEEFKARSEADRALVKEKFLKARREQELLKLARGEITEVSAA